MPSPFNAEAIAMLSMLFVLLGSVSSTSAQQHCGLTHHQPTRHGDRILLGNISQPHAWPWTAQVLVDGRHFCGATLVHPDWVLTAAHCVVRFRNQPSRLKIVLGSHYTAESPQRNAIFRPVRKVIPYPFFNFPRHRAWDLALVKIARSVNLTDEVWPVCLPFFEPPAHKECVIVGWGRTREYGGKSRELREATVPIIPVHECLSSRVYSTFVHPPSMICAGYLTGNSPDACHGDSGGPLLCPTAARGQWQVVGVTSWGSGCGRADKPGVYARVLPVAGWIKAMIVANKFL